MLSAITIFGVLAVGFMMLMYALERRHPGFVLAFAAGCLASSIYGFLAGPRAPEVARPHNAAGDLDA